MKQLNTNWELDGVQLGNADKHNHAVIFTKICPVFFECFIIKNNRYYRGHVAVNKNIKNTDSESLTLWYVRSFPVPSIAPPLVQATPGFRTIPPDRIALLGHSPPDWTTPPGMGERESEERERGWAGDWWQHPWVPMEVGVSTHRCPGQRRASQAHVVGSTLGCPREEAVVLFPWVPGAEVNVSTLGCLCGHGQVRVEEGVSIH